MLVLSDFLFSILFLSVQMFSTTQTRQILGLVNMELRSRLSESIPHVGQAQDLQDEENSDEKMVENMFGFLPNSTERREDPRQDDTQVGHLLQ